MINASLATDAVDAIPDPFTIVVQHVVAHVGLEVFAELIRVPLYLHEQALVFGLYIEVSENADCNKNRQYHTEG